MLGLKTILHPTDFSMHAAQAFQLACSLARDEGAHLLILHVAEQPLTTLGGAAALPPNTEEYGLEELKEKLRRLQESEPDISMEQRLEIGDPASVILRTAEEVSCDLIVMGTHGRTGLRRLLMGSVAEQVVRRAPRPVITVKSDLFAPHLSSEIQEDWAKQQGCGTRA
jgi:nucleotide-binding universal stress UspA family protein